MTFKWKTPQDWLVSYLKGLSKEGLFREAIFLAERLTDDQIAVLYEEQMYDGGYCDEEKASEKD